jgi:hypothetical protein
MRVSPPSQPFVRAADSDETVAFEGSGVSNRERHVTRIRFPNRANQRPATSEQRPGTVTLDEPHRFDLKLSLYRPAE